MGVATAEQADAVPVVHQTVHVTMYGTMRRIKKAFLLNVGKSALEMRRHFLY